MSVAKQLHQLQELDLELESNEQAREQTARQLGESEAVVAARTKLATEQQRLDELVRQQRATEWEIDDITAKLRTTEQELYSGKIHNPKELSTRQHDIESHKEKRSQLEDKVLEIMDEVELATKSVAGMNSGLKTLEAEWQRQQKQLSAQLEQIKTVIANLKEKRQSLITEIDPQAIEVYNELKKQKRTAVARVEQGICRGCRISLPVSEMQQARSGSLVRCSSCGRILFLA